MAADVPRRPPLGRLSSVPAILLIVAMATLVHAYLAVKLVIMAVFFLAIAIDASLGRVSVLAYQRLVRFYLSTAVIGIVWAIVGLAHPANYAQGTYDALRLYVFWSAAFLLLYSLLRTGASLQVVHRAVCIAGVLIPVINFLALYDLFSGAGIIPISVRQELALEVGIGDGYIQFGGANISSMFVIAPYLLALQFHGERRKSNTAFTKVALVLSMLLVLLSGRRALWIVVALTPGIILLLSSLTGNNASMAAGGRRFLWACTFASVLGLGTVITLRESGSESPLVTRIKAAFSAEDERTIQKPYLIDAFTQSPAFGSGFGGYAGYRRNEEKPWTYELTYYTMLFNLGVIGTASLFGLFAAYFVFVIQLLRRFRRDSAIAFGLLVGCCCLLVGAYSNPYLGGFDSLFLVGLLPYLSTFHRGFDEAMVTGGGAT